MHTIDALRKHQTSRPLLFLMIAKEWKTSYCTRQSYQSHDSRNEQLSTCQGVCIPYVVYRPVLQQFRGSVYPPDWFHPHAHTSCGEACRTTTWRAASLVLPVRPTHIHLISWVTPPHPSARQLGLLIVSAQGILSVPRKVNTYPKAQITVLTGSTRFSRRCRWRSGGTSGTGQGQRGRKH